MNPTKRIIICCDGTWNQPDIDPTNVVKLVRSIEPVAADGTQQVVFYDQGVGTGSKSDKLLGGAFGKGLAKNMLDCYRFLVHNYHEGDEIYTFGFSRGAYTSRAFAGFVYAIGLMKKSRLEQLPKAYQYYRTEPRKRPPSSYDDNPRPNIRMVGVWDTVGALGAPTPLLGRFTKPWVGFFNTHISPIIEYAYQALALDEQRTTFRPDLWTGTVEPHQTVEQCWFRGVHSDIGGGYKESGLSDIALFWMVGKAQDLGLEVDTDYLRHICHPNPNMAAHDSFSTGYKLLEKLKVKPLIRNVYGEQEDERTRPLNVTIHDTVMTAIRSGHYLPQNFDFPFPEEVVDQPESDHDYHERRHETRHTVNHVEAEVALAPDAQPLSCELLDYSLKGGVRIRTNQPIQAGAKVQIASDFFDPTEAVCVWTKEQDHGLAFEKAA
ncbi:DUF2235 domain-containing protein [Marinobacter zhejiangensis]|uniref:PilZ domain-containing protein n=1 Tax=Marinobacter zhejiangensis TaxID=488535 RepID=A0A1I4SY71_9GAMM|nr:DUF2235 domain-containing protein [Marinobacter zhejiangensis]SFM69404.1 PilZ domain-containing protein [Marinobacter zhejiangensis]